MPEPQMNPRVIQAFQLPRGNINLESQDKTHSSRHGTRRNPPSICRDTLHRLIFSSGLKFVESFASNWTSIFRCRNPHYHIFTSSERNLDNVLSLPDTQELNSWWKSVSFQKWGITVFKRCIATSNSICLQGGAYFVSTRWVPMSFLVAV
jgi:hypothetical protein